MKKYFRNISLMLVLFIILSMFLSSCVKNDAKKEADSDNNTGKLDFIISETDTTITINDPLENEITLDKKPQRVAVLMNSILDLWYMAGGTAVARVKGTINVPPEALDIEDLGSVGGPNIEKLIALKPDLVILTSTMAAHREMKDMLDQNGIKYLYVNYRVYKDFIDYLDLFTRITGREDIFEDSIAKLKEQVENTVKKVSDREGPKVLILFSSSKSVTCELPGALTGDMADMLGAENIVSDIPIEGSTRVQFSMERIVERDPDIILITTMGDVEKCKDRIKEDIESNQAWGALRAVKEGNVYYLPKEFYIYKPNAKYPEAVEYLAKILYPGVYGN